MYLSCLNTFNHNNNLDQKKNHNNTSNVSLIFNNTNNVFPLFPTIILIPLTSIMILNLNTKILR